MPKAAPASATPIATTKPAPPPEVSSKTKQIYVETGLASWYGPNYHNRKGSNGEVYDQIVKVREACGPAHLKVILETGELGGYDAVRRASLLAMAAGADFIKTSTGKVSPAATLPVTLCMLEAIRDVHVETGRVVGMKPAGGIRHSKQAIQYLCVLHETLGRGWLTPQRFRFGASSLLNDVLMQIRTQKTGVYESPDRFTID